MSWKTQIKKQKQLRKHALQVIRNQSETQLSLYKQCFDALRVQKKEQLMVFTEEQVNNHEKPMKLEVQAKLEQVEQEQEVCSKRDNLNAIANCFGRVLNSYFHKWKKETHEYKYVLNSKVKMQLLNLYNGKLRVAFNKWNASKRSSEKQNIQEMIMEEEEEFKETQNTVIELEKEIKQKKISRGEQQQRQVKRCAIRLKQRLQRYRFEQWKNNVGSQMEKENGAEKLLRRIKLRLYKSGFELYKKKVKEIELEGFVEKRMTYFKSQCQSRNLQGIVTQWRGYIQQYVQAKQALDRLFNKMDMKVKNRGFVKWNDFKQNQIKEQKCGKKEVLQQDRQKQDLEMNKLQNTIEDQSTLNNFTSTKLKSQSQKILANYLSRLTNASINEAFSRWSTFSIKQKTAQQIMRNVIQHYKSSQYKRSFQAWAQTKSREYETEKHTIVQVKLMQIEEDQLKMKRDQDAFEEEVKRGELGVAEVSLEQNKYEIRANKAIQMLEKRTDKNYYCSKLRYIFSQWKQFKDDEIRACKSIEKVMKNYLCNLGLQMIADQSKSVRKDNKVSKHLSSFFRKMEQRGLRSSFVQWRGNLYKQTVEEIQFTEESSGAQNNDFQVFERKARKHKERIAVQSNKEKTSIQLLKQCFYALSANKLLQTKEAVVKEELRCNEIANALRKWNNRSQRTKKRTLQGLFTGIKHNYLTTKRLCISLSRLESKHNLLSLQSSFQLIHATSESKHQSCESQKENSAKSLDRVLQDILKKRLSQTLHTLQTNSAAHSNETTVKRRAVLACLNRSLRAYFLRWRDQNQKQNVAQEVYEEGPARQRELKSKRDARNLERLIKEQGIDDQQINHIVEKGQEDNKQKLLKSIRRLQHKVNDQVCKPNAFDAWRQWVQHRKLFKYWLNYCNNKSGPNNTLQQAFNRLKQEPISKSEYLQSLTIEQLQERALKNIREHNDLSSTIASQDNETNEVEAVREDLIEKYSGAQRLAMAVINQGQERAKMKAFIRWNRQVNTTENVEMDSNLEHNVQHIAECRLRMKDLEAENNELVEENEDMRQMALQGIDLAKNMSAISKEREQLSVDLADKASVIKKLLEENEILKNQLKALDRVQKEQESPNKKFNHQNIDGNQQMYV